MNVKGVGERDRREEARNDRKGLSLNIMRRSPISDRVWE